MAGVFGNTVSQLILLFAFILVGFLFGRLRLLPDDAASSLSKLETYLFMPALSMQSCLQNCRMENVKQYIFYIGVSAATLLVLFALARFLAGKFARKDSEIGIYTYALTVSNMGYMGYPMMQAMFGDQMLFIMVITGIPVNIYIYTLGMAMMTQGKSSLRSLINPVFIATLSGIVLGLFSVQLPSIVGGFLSSAASCMSPVAMLISGLVISRLPIRKLFGDVRAYVASFLRLIILPAATVAVLALFGLKPEMLIIILMLYCMPIGMNTIVFPEAKGLDTTAGARLVLLSNLFSIVTIPLMVMLFYRIFPGM